MRHRTSSTTAKKQTLADQISFFSVMVGERGENLKNSDQTPNDDDDIEEGGNQKEGGPIQFECTVNSIGYDTMDGLHFMQSPERQGTLPAIFHLCDDVAVSKARATPISRVRRWIRGCVDVR